MRVHQWKLNPCQKGDEEHGVPLAEGAEETEPFAKKGEENDDPLAKGGENDDPLAKGVEQKPGAEDPLDKGVEKQPDGEDGNPLAKGAAEMAEEKPSEAAVEPLSKGQASEPLAEPLPKGSKEHADMDPLAKGSSTSSQPLPIRAWQPKGWRSSNTNVRWRPKTDDTLRVAVDWYQTIRMKDDVPPANIIALQKLAGAGVKLFLCCFCGHNREQEVRQELAGLPVPFTCVKFTREKCGDEGKVKWCQRLHLDALIDDDDGILWEAEQLSYPVYAIRTKKNAHNWCNNTYRDLPEAVEAVLKDFGKS